MFVNLRMDIFSVHRDTQMHSLVVTVVSFNEMALIITM